MERFLNIDNLLFYIKQIDDFQKVTFIFWRLKTFRREKSARNNHVSSTREFWNLRSKTKSWNFFEVRWRPYSPKESFLEDFIFNLKPFQTERFFCCNLFLIGSAFFWKKRLDKHPTSPIITIYLLQHPTILGFSLGCFLLPWPCLVYHHHVHRRLVPILWQGFLHEGLLSCLLQGHWLCHR